MLDIVEFKKEVFNTNESSFTDKALTLFHYQAQYNQVYRDFLQYLDISSGSIESYLDIPFLPIEFFRSKKILTGNINPQFYFQSSGTTSDINSRHYLEDVSLYSDSFTKGFQLIYGDIKKYCILSLLPSYLERQHSSLVFMCNELMQISNHPKNGFYFNEFENLFSVLENNHENNIPTIVFGVSFALLDFAEKYHHDLKNIIFIETGGMKGRRKEVTRQELHTIIKNAFNVESIHSEYGMTELLSQAYSNQEGFFRTPTWMKILIRDTEDPFKILPAGKTGCLNIIDLTNIHSCSFIATQDLGKINEDGSFEILGRFDNSDIRGCNLLV